MERATGACKAIKRGIAAMSPCAPIVFSALLLTTVSPAAGQYFSEETKQAINSYERCLRAAFMRLDDRTSDAAIVARGGRSACIREFTTFAGILCIASGTSSGPRCNDAVSEGRWNRDIEMVLETRAAKR